MKFLSILPPPRSIFYFSLVAASLVHAETLTWTGNGGDMQWNTAANWSADRVPAAGDTVEISNVGDEITLSAPTAELLRFSLAGATLSMTNWTTCLKADYVTIGDGGVLTCTATSDTNLVDGVEASRVWVDCVDLTIATGGAIDVNKKGFESPRSQRNGLGPYGGSRFFTYGAGHGGIPSVVSPDMPGPCGDVEEPELPGSSGSSSGWAGYPGGGFGGGVVRIDATGTVTVNGAITAVGGEFLRGSERGWDGSGAGGSVLIHCERFKGANGVVSVRGGDYKAHMEAGKIFGPNNSPKNPIFALNGSGGRIAIHYNPQSQQAGDVVGMEVDASSGSILYPAKEVNTDYGRHNQAEMGTVYLTDSSLFEAQNGQGFAGNLHIPGFTSWSTPGDYTISKPIRFRAEGFQLNVGGNLIIARPMGMLEMGGRDLERHLWANPSSAGDHDYMRYHSGTTPWSVTVGGNMILQEGMSFEAFPAAAPATEEANAYGAFVTVGGSLTLEPRALLTTRCVATNGAAVMYTAGSVNIQEEALVSAVDFGFEHHAGPGGSNKRSRVGGGYGGFGSGYICVTNSRPPYAVTYHGWTYGDPLRPWQPGSGGYYTRAYPRVRGAGGAIRIRSRGRFVLDGTIDASGPKLLEGGSDTSGIPGSGGGIFLECSIFSGSGALLADGGSIFNHSKRASGDAMGSSGGGRIAVYTGIPYNPEIMNPACLTISEEAPETFTGTASVAGGTYSRAETTYDPPGLYNGYPGTIRFVHCNVPATMILLK